jgi:hypothetical protein
MKLNNITIGADPELFIINTNTGKVVSAVGLIPGEKGDPWTCKEMPKGFGLETDNILAEFNIPPVTTKDDFVSSILYMQEFIDNFVKKISPELGIKCIASQIVPKSELQSDQAKEFGCSVDYNVYTEGPNPKPKGTTTNLRSAGTHIHCGYENPSDKISLKLIKYFDAYVGLPSVVKDRDKKRRTLYGKAGCFRLCPYGFEYRTLSSAMMNSPKRIAFIWDQVMKAIEAFESEVEIPDSNSIQEAINNSDSTLAKILISEYNIL